MDHADAELGHRTEQRHLFGRDLAGAQEGNRLSAMTGLDFPNAVAKRFCRLRPTDRFVSSSTSHEWCCATLGRLEYRQRLPALGAGHAKIHERIGGRSKMDCLAAAEVNVEATADRAKSAHRPGRGIGL